jgi:hypothetical protein
MAREPEIGPGEKVGQLHPDELPPHERRPEDPYELARETGDPERPLEQLIGPDDGPAIDPDADDLPAMNRPQ